MGSESRLGWQPLRRELEESEQVQLNLEVTLSERTAALPFSHPSGAMSPQIGQLWSRHAGRADRRENRWPAFTEGIARNRHLRGSVGKDLVFEVHIGKV